MADKIYEYNGKHYCETDMSLTDDKYAGNLYELYCDAMGLTLCETTLYYSTDNPEIAYESAEELVEDYFDDCVIGEVSRNE